MSHAETAGPAHAEPPPIDPGKKNTLLTTATAPYPAHLTGELAPRLSRWLWIVKTILAIPHFIVLAGLGVAFVATTLFAGSAILFTGRYPRTIFDFNVGVLRCS